MPRSLHLLYFLMYTYSKTRIILCYSVSLPPNSPSTLSSLFMQQPLTHVSLTHSPHAQEFLKCNPVFSTLADNDLNTLEALFTTTTLDDNQVLFEEGSRADHVYVVRRGFLRVFKAFLPTGDLMLRPTRPSRATTTTTSTSRSVLSSRPNTTLLVSNSDDVATESKDSSCGGIRVRYFDLGEIGPKGILGENGVLRPEASSSSSSSSTTTTMAAATAPALVTTAAPALLLPLPEISISNQEARGGPPKQSKETPTTDGRRPDGDGGRGGGGGQNAPVPSNAATPDGSSTTGVNSSFAPQKTVYIVSVAASGGRAEVYVAKTHGLKRLQTDGFRYCWKTAQRLHQARAQAWSATALSQQLQRQTKWEAIKRDVVSQELHQSV